jgi:DNA phosphorothioation-associated putative methyltransferase
VLVVAARGDWEAPALAAYRRGDGLLTGKGTFQKFFTQEELRTWIDGALGVRSVAAAPGVFYVFRDDVRAQIFLAARVRRRPAQARRPRVTETLYDINRDVLDPLAAFLEARGRAPELFEIPEAETIRDRFGSIKAALALVRRVTGDESWHAAQAAAIDDLLIYLALAAFGGRPKFTGLPSDVQIDVRTFFGSYKEACSAADDLLFGVGDQAAIDRACHSAVIGKLTPEALYVHTSALPRLSALLRVYEGCARAIAGAVDGTTVVKLGRLEPKISYLVYPDFDRDPHPALAMSARAHLRNLDIKFQDFRHVSNPPILHRKETFVLPDYPGRPKFARLTAQEDRLGLFSEPANIGTRNHWTALIESRGLQFRGHQLVKGKPAVGASVRSPVPDGELLPRRSEHPSSVGAPTSVPVLPAPRPAMVSRCRHGLQAAACSWCR